MEILKIPITALSMPENISGIEPKELKIKWILVINHLNNKDYGTIKS